MPIIPINGAELYYETYGTPRTGQVPVLLIHGSTNTGESTWRTAVRRLEGRHFIILPDCRGHGRSSNPRLTYTFREHAADLAALVRALGFERVHVVGHSNGGNIALLMLMEQPSVTQTCIIQAGNAWVSPDLIEKEPGLFDPTFIERERPAWLRDMKVLHSSIHGPDYWRTLVKLTVDELIAEPNYTAADLTQATRPTFVIQGAEDSVNAPMKHGEFMARHIPAAELWVPEGVGHTVHEDVLIEWLEKVTSFWNRRGSYVGEALHHHRMAKYADERDGTFEVGCVEGNLTGTVQTEVMRDEIVEITGLPADNLRVLLTPETPWALVKRPVDDLRRKPGLLEELVNQARLGEAARILEEGPEWSRIRLEHDGYIGWIHAKGIHPCTGEEARAWKSACNAMVVASLAEARDEKGVVIQKLAFATRIPVVRREGETSWVRLPDGRLLSVDSSDLLPLEMAPACDGPGIQKTLGLVRGFAGIPYRWGGRTPYGFDCSGLAGTFYAFMGVDIPRDADQQFAAGTPVESPESGDLVFFGELPEEDIPGPDAKGYVRHAFITHVGISLGGQDLIHANGAFWGISYGSLDPAGPASDQWLRENYRGARRFRS
jgi:gamma-D-glutamyl-L-lysine dipeptidyl-peptidase